MVTELKKHNKDTFEKICKLFEEYNAVAVEQPTGTGKTFLAAHTIEKYCKKRTLFITSSTTIIKEFKNSAVFKSLTKKDSIDFITYHKTLKFGEFTENDGYDLIIFDEYHRAGAPKWQKGVECIIKTYKNAKILGTTATAQRHLDNKNMTEILFDNVSANKMELKYAIDQNIVSKPKYVLALYDYEDELNKAMQKNKYYSEITDNPFNFTNNLKDIKDPQSIIKKYITNQRKFIAFCQSVPHIYDVKDRLRSWFNEAYEAKVNFYIVHSKLSNPTCDLEKFKNANNNDEFNILLVVNMLNEGIHIKTDGLFFFRGTRSKVLFLQQLGRVLAYNTEREPLVFDFVKNSLNILKPSYTNYKGNSFEGNSTILREDINYLLDGTFTIYDETLNFRKYLQMTQFHCSFWYKSYLKLAKHYKKFGHLIVSKKEDQSLYHFVLKQKKLYAENKLSDYQIELLESLGIEWEYELLSYEERWANRILQISNFKNTHGHLNVTYADLSLYKFLATQRSLFRRGKLKPERISELLALGVPLDLGRDTGLKEKKTKPMSKQERLNIRIQELTDFKNEYGHCNVPRNYHNSILAEWIHSIRNRKIIMTDELIKTLDELGFEFDYGKNRNNTQWEEMFNKLLEYKLKYGDCNVSSRYHDIKLRNWVLTQRKTMKKNTMRSDRYERLISIGFDFKVAV